MAAPVGRSEMGQHRSPRLESIGHQGLLDLRRRQVRDQRLGGVNLLAARVDPRHIQRVVLDFGRQRDGLDTGYETQVARHADAKFGLTFRHRICNLSPGGFQSGFRCYFLRNP